jgi:hypothetical protein
MPADQQASEDGLRLQGQQGGGAKRGEEQPGYPTSTDQCAGYSATTTSLPSRVRPMT